VGTPVTIGDVIVRGRPLAVIAGPCVIEGADMALTVATTIAEHCARLGLPYVFKASFDKANRTSLQGFRGPGLDEGLAVLDRVRREVGVPVTTDVHEPGQAAAAAEVADLLQVPAFLCRQTDLLVACGATGKPVNVKKGPFMAPHDMGGAIGKLRASGAAGVLVTERGTTFGYNDLVVDFRSIAILHDLGVPVVFDATHAVQRPGALGDRSGGDRRFARSLARAAVACGADAIFLEVHPDPERARSDAATQLPLDGIGELLAELAAIAEIVS